ncbi:ComF family protein [Persephonella sp.]
MNAVFPGKCVYCGSMFVFSDQNLFCQNCLSMLKKEKTVFCRSCGKTMFNCQECIKERRFSDFQVFTKKTEILTEVIYWLKIKKYRNLSFILSELIRQDIIDFVNRYSIDLITYIPLDRKTHKERGFNHLEEILKEIFPSFMVKPVIEKTRKTKLQMELSAEERRQNLKDVFRLKENITDRKVLIFDDIITTGSTMKEAFKTVKKGRPEAVFGYVIAG